MQLIHIHSHLHQALLLLRELITKAEDMYYQYYMLYKVILNQESYGLNMSKKYLPSQTSIQQLMNVVCIEVFLKVKKYSSADK
jgi:hypothetical protein